MPKTPGHGSGSTLDLAISAWKQHHPGDQGLSDVARSRILARAADTTVRPRHLGMLFFPLKRFALAGALPLILLTGMIGYLAQQGLMPLTAPESAQDTPVFASKVDGEVIFTIANGNRAHKVYLSETPNGFENAPAIVTRDGAFRDSLSGGPALVFYRID